jgi:hypothetical protein
VDILDKKMINERLKLLNDQKKGERWEARATRKGQKRVDSQQDGTTS